MDSVLPFTAVVTVVALVVIVVMLRKIVQTAAEQNDRKYCLLKRLELVLDRMEGATKVVAHDLADSVARADATEGPEGAAADAALRTGDTADAITRRQDDAR